MPEHLGTLWGWSNTLGMVHLTARRQTQRFCSFNKTLNSYRAFFFFFCVNLIIQIFIYTLRKKLPLFSPPMCYHRTSPRLREATHHPVLHMHCPGEHRQAGNHPRTHTRKKLNTTETQTWDSVHFPPTPLLSDCTALPQLPHLGGVQIQHS